MRARCVNPNAPEYRNYGGRGIKFLFDNVNHAAHWIAENLGIPEDRSLSMDRIDNNRHYEPGNLRWATDVEQQNNTRRNRGGRQRFIRFRKLHPEIRYADSTLYRLINLGLTDDQILEKWSMPFHKPKGKYGTFSTQGPYRGSLPTDG